MILRNFFSKNLQTVRFCVMALVAISLSTSFVSCSDDDDDLMGNWVYVTQMDGNPRMYATGATVEESDGTEYGYFGTGIDGDGDRLTDCWKFNPLEGGEFGSWTKLPDLPGVARDKAVSFSLKGKFYLGAGYTDVGGDDGEQRVYLSDFYCYDPSSNTWSSIDPIPHVEDGEQKGLRGCTAFVLGDKAYVGLGYDGTNYQKKFFVFDGTSWESTTISYAGRKLEGAAAFVIGDKAFVGAGQSNSSHTSEFYSFNGTSFEKLHTLDTDDDDDYSKDDDYGTSIKRSYTATFVMDGKGYFATAGQGSTGKTVWEYVPSGDKWIERTSFEGSSRLGAVGFTINRVGYVVSGGTVGASSVYDDIWRFEPSSEQSDSDNI